MIRTLRYLMPLLLIVVLLGFYWGTVTSIVSIWWRSETFAHGFLILPISLYMIWTRRDGLKHTKIESSRLALVILILCVVGWIFSYAGNVLAAEQLMFFAFIPVLVYLVYGFQLTKLIAFPLAYLIFAIPFGEELIPTLQDFTAAFTVKMLQLTGIPVFWEGRFMSIPTGNFEVAKACSGIRYLFASLALGTFYAYLTYRSYKKRLIFIIISLIMPIFANGLRAYGIVMLAYLSDNKLAHGVDHIIYGWLFFGLIMFLLFWAGNFWRDPQNDEIVEIETTGHSVNIKSSIIIAAILVLAAGPLTTSWLNYKSVQEVTRDDLKLPAEVNGWVKTNEFPSDWDPVFKGADDRYLATYKKGDKSIYVVVYRYVRQTQEKELINYLNRIYDKRNWKLVKEGKYTGVDMPLIQELIRSNQRDLLAWRWYRIVNVNITNKYLAKVLEAYSKLFSNKHSYAFVIAIPAEDSLNDERQTLRSFYTGFQNILIK